MYKYILLFAVSLCGFSYSAPETEVVALINQERQSAGVQPLAINWEVARLARYRAEEMPKLQFFDHNSPMYGNPDDMLENFGIEFNKTGVSIARGAADARRVAHAWLESASHRDKILNETFTHAGVGLSFSENGVPYWTLMLISCARSGTRESDDAVLPVLRRFDSIEASSSLWRASPFFLSGRIMLFSESMCS